MHAKRLHTSWTFASKNQLQNAEFLSTVLMLGMLCHLDLMRVMLLWPRSCGQHMCATITLKMEHVEGPVHCFSASHSRAWGTITHQTGLRRSLLQDRARKLLRITSGSPNFLDKRTSMWHCFSWSTLLCSYNKVCSVLGWWRPRALYSPTSRVRLTSLSTMLRILFLHIRPPCILASDRWSAPIIIKPGNLENGCSACMSARAKKQDLGGTKVWDWWEPWTRRSTPSDRMSWSVEIMSLLVHQFTC